MVFPSLGILRYLSVLRYAGAVVGNSSSGIVEVPSMKIPTLDIGNRQRNRIAASSVLHCGVSQEEIERGLATVLSEEWREKARNTVNPYYQPDTLEKMVNAIMNTPLEDSYEWRQVGDTLEDRNEDQTAYSQPEHSLALTFGEIADRCIPFWKMGC